MLGTSRGKLKDFLLSALGRLGGLRKTTDRKVDLTGKVRESSRRKWTEQGVDENDGLKGS
jgi:hypothetical protein